MADSNFYEEVVSAAAKDMKDMMPDLVEALRGGKRPPWTVAVPEAEKPGMAVFREMKKRGLV